MSSVVKAANGIPISQFGEISIVAKQEQRRIWGQEPESIEVQMLRAEAADEAREMVRDALEHAARIREEARQSGYLEGYSSGHDTALEDAAFKLERDRESLRADLQSFLDQIDCERRRMWRDAEPQIITFVLEIARKVVKDEARVNRDVVLSVVRNALRRVVDTENIRVRVNMEDLDTVRSSREDLASLIEGIRGVEIVADRRVDPGGCVVETGSGTIDAKIDTQFDEVVSAFRVMMDEAA